MLEPRNGNHEAKMQCKTLDANINLQDLRRPTTHLSGGLGHFAMHSGKMAAFERPLTHFATRLGSGGLRVFFAMCSGKTWNSFRA